MAGSRVLTSLVSATLLGACASVAPAADVLGGFVDMRLGGGMTGGANDLHVSDTAGAVQIDQTSRDNFKDNYRITLDWVGSTGLRNWGGWIWGVGGSFTNHSGRPTTFNDTTAGAAGTDGAIVNGKATVFAWAFDGFIGYAVPFGEHFQLELLPFIGAGRAYLDVPQGGTHTNQSNSGYLETGINLDAVWTTNSGFQFGATGGYLYWDSAISNRRYPTDTATAGSSGERFNFRADTWAATAFVGIRF